MNGYWLFGSAVAWYFLCEYLMEKLCRPDNTPTAFTFWIGLLQSPVVCLLMAAAVWRVL